MDKVRLCIVGMGNRGWHGWARLPKLTDNCELVAVCEQHEGTLNVALAQLQHDKLRSYLDIDDVFACDDIDAVALVVAPEHLPDLIVRSVEAGKHVICEVPMTFDIAECWRVVTAVERGNVKFQMGEQLRYSAWARTWRDYVVNGDIGKVLYVEGQYFHFMGDDRFYHDAETGERLHIDDIESRPHFKSRVWNMAHPILYLPHELSPLLYVLDDRVEKVTGMGTRPNSYRHEWFPVSDFEFALMHTVGDTVLRMGAGFNTNVGPFEYHTNRMFGTNGWVHQKIAPDDSDSCWFNHKRMRNRTLVEWDFDYDEVPAAARKTGHGGLDFFPLNHFCDSILHDTETDMDVYKAAESVAPAIAAATSIERGGIPITVPDFRPNASRPAGEMPSNTALEAAS